MKVSQDVASLFDEISRYAKQGQAVISGLTANDNHDCLS